MPLQLEFGWNDYISLLQMQKTSLIKNQSWNLEKTWFLQNRNITRNCICRNHTTLQLKLKKQLIYNYCETIPLEIQSIV
jgi:hypothetical protein